MMGNDDHHQLDNLVLGWWIPGIGFGRDVSAAELKGVFLITGTFGVVGTAIGWLFDELLYLVFHGRPLWAELPGALIIMGFVGYFAPMFCRWVCPNLINESEVSWRRSVTQARRIAEAKRARESRQKGRFQGQSAPPDG